MKTFPILVIIGLTLTGPVRAGDRFETIKSRLSEAICVHLDFISIIDSDVFDVIDSTDGVADIARDGRFNVTIGTDQYVYDLTRLFSYSESANQVVIEQPQQEVFNGSEIAFVTRLDEFFKTAAIKKGLEYRLVRKNPDDLDLPDTLTVTLDSKRDRIQTLRFLDINGDLNTVLIRQQTTADTCRSDLFVPDFPDSVERVRL